MHACDLHVANASFVATPRLQAATLGVDMPVSSGLPPLSGSPPPMAGLTAEQSAQLLLSSALNKGMGGAVDFNGLMANFLAAGNGMFAGQNNNGNGEPPSTCHFAANRTRICTCVFLFIVSGPAFCTPASDQRRALGCVASLPHLAPAH